MFATILSVPETASTETLCHEIAESRKAFPAKKCISFVVDPRNKTLYGYNLIFVNHKISEMEAVNLYKALTLLEGYKRDKEYLSPESATILDIVAEDIENIIRKEKLYKLPKVILLFEDLIRTYC